MACVRRVKSALCKQKSRNPPAAALRYTRVLNSVKILVKIAWEGLHPCGKNGGKCEQLTVVIIIGGSYVNKPDLVLFFRMLIKIREKQTFLQIFSLFVIESMPILQRNPDDRIRGGLVLQLRLCNQSIIQFVISPSFSLSLSDCLQKGKSTDYFTLPQKVIHATLTYLIYAAAAQYRPKHYCPPVCGCERSG